MTVLELGPIDPLRLVDRAIAFIRARGWGKGVFIRGNGSCCLVGALGLAAAEQYGIGPDELDDMAGAAAGAAIADSAELRVALAGAAELRWYRAAGAPAQRLAAALVGYVMSYNDEQLAEDAEAIEFLAGVRLRLQDARSADA